MSLHQEIAKERFLDIMASKSVAAEAAAVVAIEQADVFVKFYGQYGKQELETAEEKTKGCPRCFGSGGKRNHPCNACNGTGKVKKD